MRKITIILILGIFIGGCSLTRNIGKVAPEDSNKLFTGNVLESVKGQNITNFNFFIQKAEIEIVTQKGKGKYLGNIKFEKPDKYLISIRSQTGIEGARIYIDGDTLLVNDRINKKLYFGTSYYLEKKYGLTQSFLPLILGDIVLDKSCEESQEKCSGDKLIMNCLTKGIMLNYEIDCRKRKTILVGQINNFVQNGIKIKYESFRYIGNIFVPRIVELEDYKYNTTIRLKILKIDSMWKGTIKFVPGKGYELIELV